MLGDTTFAQLLPGESLDLNSKEDRVIYYPDLVDVLEDYQDQVASVLEERDEREPAEWEEVKVKLADQLEEKIKHFPLVKGLEGYVLYFEILGGNKSQRGILLDFKLPGEVQAYHTNKLDHRAAFRYTIFATIDEFAVLADKRLTWYEWLLSFRLQIRRKPDVFSPLLDGFLVNEASELKAFCEHYNKRPSAEKITVQVGNTKYRVCKRCPHDGGDLSKGFTDEYGNLVCPKHSWKFNLKNGGYCEEHNATIDAVRIDE